MQYPRDMHDPLRKIVTLSRFVALSVSITRKFSPIQSARGYGVGLGVRDAMVFAGGFKGNSGLDAIDVYNTTTKQWSHAKMSTGRTLFDGAALGHTAIFGCGEGAGGGTADIFNVLTGEVKTVKLKGGSRKKCAATAVTLAVDTHGVPTEGKILIAGGYKSVAVDVWDLKTNTWSLTKMSISHFCKCRLFLPAVAKA